jgi:hypothetical protein
LKPSSNFDQIYRNNNLELSPDHDTIFGHEDGVKILINLIVYYGSYYPKRRVLKTFNMCIWASDVSWELPFSAELEKQHWFVIIRVKLKLMIKGVIISIRKNFSWKK